MSRMQISSQRSRGEHLPAPPWLVWLGFFGWSMIGCQNLSNWPWGAMVHLSFGFFKQNFAGKTTFSSAEDECKRQDIHFNQAVPVLSSCCLVFVRCSEVRRSVPEFELLLFHCFKASQTTLTADSLHSWTSAVQKFFPLCCDTQLNSAENLDKTCVITKVPFVCDADCIDSRQALFLKDKLTTKAQNCFVWDTSQSDSCAWTLMCTWCFRFSWPNPKGQHLVDWSRVCSHWTRLCSDACLGAINFNPAPLAGEKVTDDFYQHEFHHALLWFHTLAQIQHICTLAAVKNQRPSNRPLTILHRYGNFKDETKATNHYSWRQLATRSDSTMSDPA